MSGDEDSYDKRRRNLIVTSLALLASLWSDARVEHFNLLGVVADPPKVYPLACFLGVLWVYFLWRFWTLWQTQNERRKFADAWVSEGHRRLFCLLYTSPSPRD